MVSAALMRSPEETRCVGDADMGEGPRRGSLAGMSRLDKDEAKEKEPARRSERRGEGKNRTLKNGGCGTHGGLGMGWEEADYVVVHYVGE